MLPLESFAIARQFNRNQGQNCRAWIMMIGVPCITRWLLSSHYFPCCNVEKYQDGRGPPSSPKPKLAGTVPQGMTLRCPMLPWLVSSRLSDILMRWDLAVSQCKCRSLSFSLPHLLRPPSFFVPSSSSSATLPSTFWCSDSRLSLSRSLFEYVRYRIIRNIIEMDDNEKYLRLLFERNRICRSQIYLHIILLFAQLRPFSINNAKLFSFSLYYISTKICHFSRRLIIPRNVYIKIVYFHWSILTP